MNADTSARKNWRDSPEVLERLAAAYALGTLAGPARRRFETVMKTHPAAVRAVADWNRRFEPLAARLPTQAAAPALWARIEQRSFGASASVSASPPAAAAGAEASRSAPAWRRWLDALLAPVPAAALVAGLAVGLVLPALWPLLHTDPASTELPESYVGVLATAAGRTGMIVSSRRHGTVVDLKRVAEVPVPAGKTLYLWVIDAQGRPSGVGPVPQGAFVRVNLPQTAEAIFAKAVELGMSIEPTGTAPIAPSLPYAYRGLCGKLWRVASPP